MRPAAILHACQVGFGIHQRLRAAIVEHDAAQGEDLRLAAGLGFPHAGNSPRILANHVGSNAESFDLNVIEFAKVVPHNFLLVKETAELLGVSANTVRVWATTGKLQEYRHPVNNYRLFKREEVEALLEQIVNPEPVEQRIRKAR